MSELSRNRLATLRFAPIILLLALLVGRVLTLGTVDIIDSTEGRYAAVAKHMYLTGDWITPWIYRDGELVPYLGKPPLHFWLTSLTFHFFGISTETARLPSLLGAFAIVMMTFAFARRFFSESTAVSSALILSSSGMFFFVSASALIDMTLSFTIALAIFAFAFSLDVEGKVWSKIWGYLFFMAIGLGLLAKGPIALVIIGIVLVPWMVVHRSTLQLSRIPWPLGCCLALAVAGPWYLAAELREPGFLRYFLINENILRFLLRSYGDKYGTGHHTFVGASWFMLFWSSAPWSLLLVALGLHSAWLTVQTRNFSDRIVRPFTNLLTEARRWDLLVILWTISVPLMLTPTGQVTPNYILPVFPGLALFAARILENYKVGSYRIHGFRITAATIVILASVGVWMGATWILIPSAGAIAACLWFGSHERNLPCGNTQGLAVVGSFLVTIIYTTIMLSFGPHISGQRSTRSVFELARSIKEGSPITIDIPYYFPFSAQFYDGDANGKEETIQVASVNPADIGSGKSDFLLIQSRDDHQCEKDACKPYVVRAEEGRWLLLSKETTK